MKWHFTEYNPKAGAEDRRELVCPDGTLSGITIRTLVNGWGQYEDRKRADLAKRLLDMFNKEEGAAQ
jgi:hypothetical protein